MTKQQLIIRRLLERSETHPTAEELYLEAKKEMPNISMGTVYRNLGQMAEEGSIVRLHFAGHPDHYDKTIRPHDHAICVKCGLITDVELNSIKPMIEDALHVGILSYELNIQCVCNACQSKAS
jgi:Fe2+ or Zn2+ uptake regulation protein